jgi:arsenical pump membrane protein
MLYLEQKFSFIIHLCQFKKRPKERNTYRFFLLLNINMTDPLVPLIVFAFVIILILGGFSKRVASNRFLKYIFDYGSAPLIGVVILLITSSINLNVIFEGIIGTDRIQPYGILILFMSLAYVCISIDHTGFFEYLALRAAKGAGRSGKKLFIYFFFVSSFLTIFTSNDIVILTLTPIICYFAKYTKADPVPYIIGQFFAANIWSIMLYIGNPTNIIVAQAYHLPFIGYTAWMFFPTVTAGLSGLLLLYVLFRKRIPTYLETPVIDPRSAIKDKFGAIFGVISLAACLVLLSTASWLNIQLWIITLFFAILMLIRDIIHDMNNKMKNNNQRFPSLLYANRRMPWKIVPFIIGMFILVGALLYSGWVDLIASAISNASTNIFMAVFLIGIVSALTCNVMNNQPMTILFTNILLNSSLSSSLLVGGMFALIMGSNFGANFTLIGALAGIMWFKIIQNQDVTISFKQFSKYGFLVMPLVMLLSYGVLVLELLFWPPLL